MFTQAPEWISRSPRIRKVIVKIWRAFLRVQRATAARAVLIARRQDDCMLAVAALSGELRLPSLELDAWEPVGTQVRAWVERTLQHPSRLELHVIEGTPSNTGVTFLYSAEVSSSPDTDHTWVEIDLARSALSKDDRRLLTMSGRRSA